MTKVKETCRKLFFSTSYRRLLYCFIVFAAAIFMAFFSQKVIFHYAELSAKAYDMKFLTTEDALPENVPLDVSYDGETIQLVTNTEVSLEEIDVYASTRFGAAKLTEENMETMDETFLGSFVIAYPKQSYDIDGDEQNENVMYSVKTDLREVQSNAGTTPLFRDSKITMEVGMDSFEALFIYFQTKPLMEREVIVHLADGTSYTTMTDAAGYLAESPTVKQIRQGVTIEYAPNGLNTYICRYVPETYSVFSKNLLPFLILLVLAIGTIGFCILLRRFLIRKQKERDYTIAYRPRGTRKLHRTHKPVFVIVRWMVMLVSFVLLTWGGSWLGLWFEELYLPVLSCSKYNPEQIVGSACYYMSHLNILFTLELRQILVFFACFFIPLFLFGKLFCGFICPMGLTQDILHVTRQKCGIQGISMTEKSYERLAIIKWAAVMLFLGMGFAGLDFCNICPAVTLSPAFSGFKTTIYISGFVMLFVLVGSFFKSRFFCNICPLGLLMGLVNKVSLVRLKKDTTACTECGACYNACPMGIKTIYTEREKANVTDMNCLMCGECIRNCPENDALKITLAGHPIYTSSRDGFMKRFDEQGCKSKRNLRRRNEVEG